MRFNVSTMRAIVRPAITLLLALAFVLYAHFDQTAFSAIKETAISAIFFYLGMRTAGK